MIVYSVFVQSSTRSQEQVQTFPLQNFFSDSQHFTRPLIRGLRLMISMACSSDCALANSSFILLKIVFHQRVHVEQQILAVDLEGHAVPADAAHDGPNRLTNRPRRKARVSPGGQVIAASTRASVTRRRISPACSRP